VDEGLLRRLRTEQARMLLFDADPQVAVMLACDLLVAGVDGEAVMALAGESARTLPVNDADRRLADVIEELGLPEPDPATAVTLLAADTCERILARSVPVEDAIHRLYVVGHEDSPLSDLRPVVSALAGRLEDELCGRADDDLRARTDTFARDVLRRLGRPAGPQPAT
jgi:hypothetical protein